MPTPATANPIAAHFQTMHAFEVWANARAVSSLESVPESNRTMLTFLRASQVLAHNTLARQVWLSRMLEQPYDNPRDWFPTWSIDAIRAQMAYVDGHWLNFLAGLTGDMLARESRYQASDGTPYVSTFQDILTHVFNHGTYHRGQVARLVHESGGQRASTDFIAFSRRVG